MQSDVIPTASVIVPVFNVEDYLPALLVALDAQTQPHVEFILVNDGSVDDSGRLCDQYAANRPWVHVVHHRQSLGVSAARNAGLERARGRWVGFADSDDLPQPALWQQLVTAGEADNLDVVLCNGGRFTQTPGDTAGLIYAKAKQAEVVSGEAWLAQAIGQDDYRVFVYLTLVRRSFVEAHKLRFETGIVHEDILWMTRLLLAASRVRYLDVPLYYWRYRGTSITQDDSETMALSRMRGYAVVVQSLAQDAERATPPTRSALRSLAAKEGINLIGLLHRLSWRSKALMCRELEKRGLTRLMSGLGSDAKLRRRLLRVWFWSRLAGFVQ